MLLIHPLLSVVGWIHCKCITFSSRHCLEKMLTLPGNILIQPQTQLRGEISLCVSARLFQSHRSDCSLCPLETCAAHSCAGFIITFMCDGNGKVHGWAYHLPRFFLPVGMYKLPNAKLIITYFLHKLNNLKLEHLCKPSVLFEFTLNMFHWHPDKHTVMLINMFYGMRWS